jgi:hypothetical protein
LGVGHGLDSLGRFDARDAVLEVDEWQRAFSFWLMARTGDSRFLAELGMTISFRNCQERQRQGQEKKQIPKGNDRKKDRSRSLRDDSQKDKDKDKDKGKSKRARARARARARG